MTEGSAGEEIIDQAMKDFSLKPFGLGYERLKEHLLPIRTADKGEITIGRTAVEAGDYHQFISRQHIIVHVEDAQLFVTSKTQEGCVHVNSSPIGVNIAVRLFEGDVISLLGPKRYFNFRVCTVDHVEPAVKKRMREGDDSMRDSTTTKSVKKISRDKANIESSEADSVKNNAECSICLQLMALCHSVVPCGHNFCYVCIRDCLKKLKKCPTCSADAANTIPCRILDDIIRATVVTKNSTDVAFEKRYNDGLEAYKKKIPVAVASKPIKKNKINNFFEVVDLS